MELRTYCHVYEQLTHKTRIIDTFTCHLTQYTMECLGNVTLEAIQKCH